jgi:hypothetical protein
MDAAPIEFLENMTVPIILRRRRCPCSMIATPEDRNFGGSTGREWGFVVHAQSPRNNRAMRRAWTETAYTAAEIAELIGHEQGFTFSVYAPMQLPMKALKELIERIRYPGLRLSHLYVG